MQTKTISEIFPKGGRPSLMISLFYSYGVCSSNNYVLFFFLKSFSKNMLKKQPAPININIVTE